MGKPVTVAFDGGSWLFCFVVCTYRELTQPEPGLPGEKGVSTDEDDGESFLFRLFVDNRSSERVSFACGVENMCELLMIRVRFSSICRTEDSA